MKKIEFSDGKFILKTVLAKDFIKPSKGDFIRIEKVNYQVDTIIYEFDKEKLIVVCNEVKK